MVLLALALPRHAPHQPPRAASRFLLRRRFAVGRRLRDRWAAAPCQLDGLLLKFLPRFFYFVRRAGAIFKKLLGDLFSFFFVADDLRGGRSFSFEILSRRRRRRRGVVTVTASARWRGGLPAGGRRVARGSLAAKAWGESAPGPTSAAAARPIKSSKKRIFGLPEALGIGLQAAHAELLRNSSKSI